MTSGNFKTESSRLDRVCVFGVVGSFKCYVPLVTLTMAVREGVLPLCGGGGAVFYLGHLTLPFFQQVHLIDLIGL